MNSFTGVGKLRAHLYLAAGIVLTLVFWYVNWYTSGLRTHWAFFPLWLGYIFTIDAIVVLRGRTSLFFGKPRDGWLLFLVSIPLWWLFEWLNERAHYWVYLPEDTFSPLAHTFWSTICFSTVVPAIFVTARLLLTVPAFRWHLYRRPAAATARGRVWYATTGFAMLIALLIWPHYGMAFMWVSLFFIIGPLNVWLGRPSLMGMTARGDWRMVVVFFAAALICGFFWELWNWFAWPKWIYTFPFLDGLKVFEMPLAGYLGYLPFGLEVWAMTVLVLPRIGNLLSAELEGPSTTTSSA